MNNLFKFFSKIYCVNLVRRPDRREHMRSLFEKLDIYDRVNWFNAIDTPHDGRVGCRLSHLNIIKQALENKTDNVLIFEDDIELTPYFNLEDLGKGIDALKCIDWDIIYLGGRVVEPATDINEFLFKSSLWSAGSLCINHTVFEKCLKMEQYTGPVDWFYSSPVQNFKCYSVNPCMFVQTPELGSDLTQIVHDRRDMFIESYKNRHHASAPVKEWLKIDQAFYE